MDVLIVYDSMYDNTERIAQAMGQALEGDKEVQVRRVGDLQPTELAGVPFLLVGAPTHGFRPSPAMKAFLAGIPA
ncbi:MAG: nitric oxide synthase, partial [Chloroflexi bacterium]|nr:nitric oxide synthase [Chloroflexota bacterium]